jgi:hypothetical protein
MQNFSLYPYAPSSLFSNHPSRLSKVFWKLALGEQLNRFLSGQHKDGLKTYTTILLVNKERHFQGELPHMKFHMIELLVVLIKEP